MADVDLSTLRGSVSPAGELVLDDVARVLAHNDAARTLLSASAEALDGAPFATLLTASTRFFLQTHVFPELSLNGRVDEVYVTLAAFDGTRVPVILAARRERVRDSFVDVVGFLPVRRRSVGETEVRTAHEAQREALARASAAEAHAALSERLATMGTLAASVAHEINNPLAYAITNLDVLESALVQAVAGDDLRTLVHETRDGLLRIRDIVASLRKLTRVDETREEPIDLGKVVASALRLSSGELRQRARIEVDIERPAPRVLGDDGRLCQVVVNLIVNATQALRGSTGRTHVVRVVARTVGADAILEVADDGPGVPLEIQDRVFDPFFTTKALGEGTGLGLAVCREIVRSMRGTIELESEPGRGATFRIRIPALLRGTSRPTSAPRSRPDVELAGRALVVDDDPLVARAVTRALVGCEVVTCTGSLEALEVIRAERGAFDLVLCDLMMPAMSGMELHARVATEWPELAERMFVVTGGAFTDETRAFVERMGHRAIQKPFGVQSLRAAVADVLARSVARSERGG